MRHSSSSSRERVCVCVVSTLGRRLQYGVSGGYTRNGGYGKTSQKRKLTGLGFTSHMIGSAKVLGYLVWVQVAV